MTDLRHTATDRYGDLLLERPLLKDRFREAIRAGNHDQAVELLQRIRRFPDELLVAQLIAAGGAYSTHRDALELELRAIFKASGVQ